MQYIENDMQNEEIIRFEAFEAIGKYIYAQVIDKNILVRFSLDSAECKVIHTNDDYRFKYCTYLNDKLYFVDNLGEALAEYDVKSYILKTYDMNIHIKDDNNIAAVENNQECVFIVSQYKGVIFIFDTKNKVFKREETLKKKLKELYGEQTECIIRCWKIEEYLYFIINNKDDYYLCNYNMRKRSLQEISKTPIHFNMINAYCFGWKLYILQDDFTLCIWDVKSNQTQIIEMTALTHMIDRSKLKYKYAFSVLAVTKKNVWLFPAGENEDIYVYNLSEKTAKKYNEYPSDFSYLSKKGWSKYSNIRERDGYIYVAARLSNYYLIIDIETGKEHWKAIGSCDFSQYYHDMIVKRSEKKQITHEQNKGMINAFLNYYQGMIQYSEKDCYNGSKIWEALR